MTSNRRTLAAAAVAAVFALLWLLMFLQGAGELDRIILHALYAGHRPAVADAARMVTLLGGGTFVTLLLAVAALALAFRGRLRTALILFAGGLLGRLLVDLQKDELGRLRPDANPHLVEVTSLSFPSGHAANAVVTYVGIVLLTAGDGRSRRIGLSAAAALSLVIGLSRVVLGVHWPSDVVAGWSFGLLWVLFMLWTAERTHAEGRAQ
jgi:membrane-associated phospholipid phosphatase